VFSPTLPRRRVNSRTALARGNTEIRCSPSQLPELAPASRVRDRMGRFRLRPPGPWQDDSPRSAVSCITGSQATVSMLSSRYQINDRDSLPIGYHPGLRLWYIGDHIGELLGANRRSRVDASTSRFRASKPRPVSRTSAIPAACNSGRSIAACRSQPAFRETRRPFSLIDSSRTATWSTANPLGRDVTSNRPSSGLHQIRDLGSGLALPRIPQ
jgi:hypothetical protein